MTTRHFFVDEAGDLTLFDRHGRPMTGREGVSSYFMVGVVEILLPDSIGTRLHWLRSQMLTDPYFNRAPSFDRERRRTAVVFHAKDDLPEVRWRVYEQLRAYQVRFAAVVRRKSTLEALARATIVNGKGRVRLDDIYDDLVTRLFEGRLLGTQDHHITFAVRKTANRDTALTRAVERAKRTQACSVRFTATSDWPSAVPGLQVVDYYLWATQRAFERREGRFIAGLADQIEYVWDLDDLSSGSAGTRYEGKHAIQAMEASLPLAPARFEQKLEHPT